VVILGLIGWALGIDPHVLIGGAEMMSQNGQTQQQADSGRTGPTGAPSDEMGHFVSAILGSTEAEWTEIFAGVGKTYKPPTLVMFSGATQSGCGFAKAAMGPFYCPIDQKVYLDTSFFQDLERRFRACDVGSKSCQFSEAYVIAHEIGHHVQNLLGLLPKVQEAQRGMEKADANSLQVRVELQADCLAGVWANRAQAKWQFIEPGDVESALQTASAILVYHHGLNARAGAGGFCTYRDRAGADTNSLGQHSRDQYIRQPCSKHWTRALCGRLGH
jgi:predicted metalloprotease